MTDSLNLSPFLMSLIPIDEFLSVFLNCQYNDELLTDIIKFIEFELENQDILRSCQNYSSLKKNFELFFNLNNETETIIKLLKVIKKQYDFSTQKSIFNSTSSYDNINNILKKDGVYIHDETLSASLCDEILHNCNFKNFELKNARREQIIDIFNPPPGTSWIVNHTDVVKSPIVQKLLTDQFILTVAQNYLGSKPIAVQTNFWVSREGDTDNTQQWHQDHDDVKFLKVFIYLNDVTPENGSHNYVVGSINNPKPTENYYRSTRVSDEKIRALYGNSSIEISGKKGTIIFEDTNGFHKGGLVQKGCRYMLQFQYSVSTQALSSSNYSIHPIYLDQYKDSILFEAKSKYPYTFVLYKFFPIYANVKECIFTSGCCRLLCCFDQSIIEDKTVESIHYMNVGGIGGVNFIAHPYTPKHHLYFLKYIYCDLSTEEIQNAETVFLMKSIYPSDVMIEYKKVYPEYDMDVCMDKIRERIGTCKTFIFELSSIKEHYAKGSKILHHQWLNMYYKNELDEIIYTKEQYITEIIELIKYVKQQSQNTKIILMGHIRYHLVDKYQPIIPEREVIYEAMLEVSKIHPEITIIDPVSILTKDDIEDNKHFKPSGYLKLYDKIETLVLSAL